MSGSAAVVTAELDALTFTPNAGAPATQSTTTFTLSDVSSVFTYLNPIEIVHSFDSSFEVNPSSVLIADAAGDLFGTTQGGGWNLGAVFEIPKTSAGYGAAKPIAGFDYLDGAYPVGGLIRDAAGDLFGTTLYGGANNAGTVFEVAKTASGYGPIQTLASFDSNSGTYPLAGLSFDVAGNLLGTVLTGDGNSTFGSVFEIARASNDSAGASFTMFADRLLILLSHDFPRFAIG